MPFLIRCHTCQKYYCIPRGAVSPTMACTCRLSRLEPRRTTAAGAASESSFGDGSETESYRSLIEGCFSGLVVTGSVTILWMSAAVALQMEIGWLAWGLGAFTGYGMHCGPSHSYHRLAGILACSLSLVGIVIAKLLTFLVVLLPILRQIDPTVSGTPQLFAATMFDPVDGLFILLGLVTAYRIGSQRNAN